MATSDLFQEMQEQRKQEHWQAEASLKKLAEEKPLLKRPVFFVPGWTDEGCTCWTKSYLPSYLTIRDWMGRIAKNSDFANYIKFTTQESKGCESFSDFSDLLKEKVWETVDRGEDLDLIGHSMGGLDSVAAIVDDGDPLKQVRNLITVATPHLGSNWGEIGPKIKDYPEHHRLQCVNLDPDRSPIKIINKIENRKRLLENVQELLYFEGTRDMAVMRGARFNTKGLIPRLAKKVTTVYVGGATHSQKDGITQDPRTIYRILCQLLDIPVPVQEGNRGYIYRKA